VGTGGGCRSGLPQAGPHYLAASSCQNLPVLDPSRAGMRRPATSTWASGAAYEPYVGRWSRLVAREFLPWLAVPPESRWLDVGCGTGALSAAILAHALPATVTGIDTSEGYVAYARGQVSDGRARFEQGDAQALPFGDGSFEATVSGLALNFLPEPGRGLAEMARVTRPGGVVAVYVWDYAGEMQLMRHFWNAATALDPAALELDEGRRYPICRPDALDRLFTRAGMEDVAVRPVDVPTLFRDFDDYWSPFLGGQGPAPAYAMSLTEERREALRERVRADLPVFGDGSIPLTARAWAARGRRPALTATF
jgi:SAM-dependent methyltransferase